MADTLLVLKVNNELLKALDDATADAGEQSRSEVAVALLHHWLMSVGYLHPEVSAQADRQQTKHGILRQYPQLSQMTYSQVDLEMATRHVAQAKRHISEQEERIAWLRSSGFPTEQAEDLLNRFHEALTQHSRHLEAITAALGTLASGQAITVGRLPKVKPTGH